MKNRAFQLGILMNNTNVNHVTQYGKCLSLLNLSRWRYAAERFVTAPPQSALGLLR